MIEPLETRIAPAAVFVTYTDLDGDLVKITATKAGAAVAPLDATDLTFVGGGAAGQLAKLDLTAPAFDGAKIVFTVTKRPGGDGLAHVGFIDATGVDLDQVVVKGDLAKIVVGDATIGADAGLNLLSVRSMGARGLVTGATDLGSVVTGNLGALKVAGDVTDASLNANSNGAIGSLFIGGDLTGGSVLGSARIFAGTAIGSVTVGGDVRGGDGVQSGAIIASSTMGAVKIGGDVIGGAGAQSGLIFTSGTMGAVKIGGDVIGGGGQGSGRIDGTTLVGAVTIGGDIVGGAGADSGWVFSSGTMGNVKIAGSITGGVGAKSGVNDALGNRGSVTVSGNLTGGTGSESGRILGAFAMGSVKIGGSVLGGAGLASGTISAGTDLGPVSIGGDLIGASAAGSGMVFNSGSISGRHIASVTLGGSIVAGSDDSAGSVTFSGAIIAIADLGPVKIGGSIVGNETVPVFILAKGQFVKPATGFDTAIASITVKGDVRFAQIRAGFDFDLNAINADASIGAVAVGGDWAASNLVAGAQDTGAPGFGIGDTLHAVGNTALIARIASIAIKGDVTGSLSTGDHFGFVAQQIGSFKASGFTAPLTPAATNQNIALPFTIDVRILEV